MAEAMTVTSNQWLGFIRCIVTLLYGFLAVIALATHVAKQPALSPADTEPSSRPAITIHHVERSSRVGNKR
jgi:hypothetical protein